MIRSDIDWDDLRGAFAEALPFPHVVIDDFFEPGVAEALERDIPAFDDPSWMQYSNPIEEKRALNHWDRFPVATYQVFAHLNGTFLESAGGQRITEVQLKRGDTIVLADNAAAFLYQI